MGTSAFENDPLRAAWRAAQRRTEDEDPLRAAWRSAQRQPVVEQTPAAEDENPLATAYRRAQQPRQAERGALSRFGRGLALGGAESVTSLGEVAGMIPGLGGVGESAKATRQRLEEELQPSGTAGAVGRFIGRAGGEIAQAITGGPLVAKAIGRVAPSVGKALQAGMASERFATRAAAQAAASAPIDIVQGLKEEEGLVLPGRLGAVTESVLFSGAAGGLARPRPRPVTPTGVEAAVQGTVPPVARRTTPLTENVMEPERYANIERMTAQEPEMVGGLRETIAGAVEQRELPERFPRRATEKLGRLREAETEEIFRERLAELYGVNPSDIVARTAQGERVDRFALQRATEELLDTQLRIDGITNRLRSGMVGDPQEVLRLEALRDVERNKAYDLFASISKQTTETARDLAAMRFGVSLSDNPIVWKDRLEELAKRQLSADELAEVESLARAGDVNGLMKLGTDIRQATTREKGITLYKTSLLTSLKTMFANLIGNESMQVLRQIRDVPATFIDMALASRTGQRSKMLDIRGRWNALRRAVPDSLQDSARVMRGELPMSQKFSEIREVNFNTPVLNLYTKGVLRSLDATDRFFKGMATAESIDEMARVMAFNKGLRGDAAEEFVKRLVQNPTMDMAADAALAAEIATFQQNSEIARMALSARRKLGVLGDLLFPFAKTPANIAGTIVNYSPLGVMGQQLKVNMRRVLKNEATVAQQRMVAERLGEAFTGSALMYLGYILGEKGKMTGFYPSDERTRAQWEAEGKLEGAVKVGNDWVQINRISPFGNLLTIGAAMADVARGDPDVLSLLVGGASAPLSAVVDLPMVQGLSNISEVLDPQATPEQKQGALANIGGGIIGGAVPFSGMLRSIAQTIDPTVRETRTDGKFASAINRVQASLPIVSERLQPRFDALGRPIERGGTALERFASPFRRERDLTTVDPLRAALAEANAVVGRVSRRKGETPEAYATRAQLTGETVRQAVGRMVESPGYAAIDTMNVDRLRRGLVDAGVDTEGLSDDGIRNAWRSVVLDRVIRRAKSVASRRMPNTTPSLVRQLERAVERQP